MSSGTRENTRVKKDGKWIYACATGFKVGTAKLVPAAEFLTCLPQAAKLLLHTWVKNRSPVDGHLRKLHQAFAEFGIK